MLQEFNIPTYKTSVSIKVIKPICLLMRRVTKKYAPSSLRAELISARSHIKSIAQTANCFEHAVIRGLVE